MDNYQVILDFFENSTSPLNAGAVAEGTGVDRKEVDKVMAKLKKEENCFSQTLLL